MVKGRQNFWLSVPPENVCNCTVTHGRRYLWMSIPWPKLTFQYVAKVWGKSVYSIVFAWPSFQNNLNTFFFYKHLWVLNLEIAAYLNYYWYHKNCRATWKLRVIAWIGKKCNRYLRKHLWLYTLSGYLGKHSTAGTTLLIATWPKTCERKRFSRKPSLHLQI